MILNELQYRITKREAQKFKEAISALQQRPLGETDPILRKAEIDAMESQWTELREELAAYDALKRREHTQFSAHSLADLSLGLIQARIALGLSQEELANRLGVTKQQVQRDEDNLYAGASLQRLTKIAEVLGVKVAATMELVP